MEKLYNLLTEEELEFIKEINTDIENNSDITNLLLILENLRCDNKTIKHIILSNPKYLTNNSLRVLEMIKTLHELGLTNLDKIFEINPYLLNKEKFEIENFISQNLNKGIQLKEIIDMIDTNPFIFDNE